jgi:LemA protein
MSQISTTFVFWGLLAVTVCWILGAYNRLVRLRAQWVRALHQLVLQWQSHARAVRQELAHLSNAPQSDAQWAQLHDDVAHWQPLAMATRQFQLCLAGLLTEPQTIPAPGALAAIGVAQTVMANAWQHLKNTHDDLAGAAVPQQMEQLWQQQDVLAQERRRDCNQCAAAYNQAIAQFPAFLVAWIFSFHVAPTV